MGLPYGGDGPLKGGGIGYAPGGGGPLTGGYAPSEGGPPQYQNQGGGGPHPGLGPGNSAPSPGVGCTASFTVFFSSCFLLSLTSSTVPSDLCRFDSSLV